MGGGRGAYLVSQREKEIFFGFLLEFSRVAARLFLWKGALFPLGV